MAAQIGNSWLGAVGDSSAQVRLVGAHLDLEKPVLVIDDGDLERPGAQEGCATWGSFQCFRDARADEPNGLVRSFFWLSAFRHLRHLEWRHPVSN